MKRLYVGNLPFTATQDDVLAEFSKYGQVRECKLITDRETGKARGFGFVTFENSSEADQAIQALHGQNYGGRALTVNEAEDRRPQGGGGGNFNRGGGSGGSGGGNSRPVVTEVPRDFGGGDGRKGGGSGRRQRGGARYDQD